MKKKMDIKVKVIKLGSNSGPTITENKRKDYIEFGVDNKFPQHLLDLSQKTALHTAILDKKVKMGVGTGIVLEDATPKSEKFIQNVNPQESLEDLNLKIMSDLEIFGAYYLQVIWSKDGKSVAEMYHMPYDRIRSGKMNDKNQIDEFYYSEKWEKYTRPQDIKIYPAFNMDKNKKQIQILKGGKYNPSSMYYSQPSYIGGITDIDTLAEISEFHNAAIKNNFAPGALIIFKSRGSDEEMDTVVRDIEKKYQGSNKAGEPIIFFIDEDQPSPEITQMEVSDLDKQFQQLSDTTDRNVTLAHSIPRILAGLETPGSLGSSKEVVDASVMFFNQYVEPHQQIVLKTYNKIMDINRFSDVKIMNANPSLLLYSESFLEKILTQDEMREVFGFEALDNVEVTKEEIEAVEPVEKINKEDDE